MQEFVVALLIGLILGWIIEWLIDWRYWRPTVAALRKENAALRRQLEEQAKGQPVAASPEVTTSAPHKGN